MDFPSLREEVCEVNRQLQTAGLVVASSGNASGIDRETGIVLIKPSGIDYAKLTPDQLVAVDLESGDVKGGDLRPSVDLPHHLYLYRHWPTVGGIVHTHSNHATAFAAVGRPIPVYLTALADQFGAEVPVAPYTDNQGDHIGEAILKYANQTTAILLEKHGVFTWGSTPKQALKSALMLEDTAKTLFIASQLGKLSEFPPEETQKWHQRYQHNYGQSSSKP